MGEVGERLAHFTKNAQQFSSVIAQDPFKEEMLYASNWNKQSKATMLRGINVFSPCALGGSVNHEVLDTMVARDVIVPGANNPEESEEMLDLLMDKGIIMVPAFVANNGGVKMIAHTIENPNSNYSDKEMVDNLKKNLQLTTDILTRSKEEGVNPTATAIRMANEIIKIKLPDYCMCPYGSDC